MKCFHLLPLIFLLSRQGTTLPSNRITNGNEATPGQFPYQVLLDLVPRWEYFDLTRCSGSLLSHRYVLTAGHCLYFSERGFALFGAHNLATAEDHRIRMDFSEVDYVLHEDFVLATLRNDIGLVRLPAEVTFSGYIQPVQLARWSDGDFYGETATFAGWGTNLESGTDFTDVLYYVTNTIYDNEHCRAVFRRPDMVHEHSVCVSGQAGRSACHGDYGGPVTVQRDSDVVQIGVFSVGAGYDCLNGMPFVNVRITHFLEWIQANSDVIIEA